MSEIIRPTTGAPASEATLLTVFAQFLRIDVANGDASPDTIRGYRAQVRSWVQWCRQNQVDAATVTAAQVKEFRRHLVEAGYKASAIGHKLTIMRRFYEAAVDHGLRPDNPVAGVRPPRNKQAYDDVKHLSEVELALLLRAVPKDRSTKSIRDRVIIGLMALHGLRTVEIGRASAGDLQGSVLVVRGKNHDRVVHLRPDVLAALQEYAQHRGPVAADTQGEPLVTAVGNRAGGRRISRRGLRQIIDSYLRAAELKRPGISGHALRHTAGTLSYKHTRDLRGVQDMLGHMDPKTTARYAHVVDRAQNNPALAVPIRLSDL